MTQNNEREAVEKPEYWDEFERWWETHGQYCRAGGGEYEKSFAWAAFEYLKSTISHNEQLKQIPDGWKLVPIESDEQMKDGARAFLAGLELGVKTFENMSEHLRLSGAYLPDWFLKSKGHINKMAKAHYIYEAMINASPTNTEVGE